MTRGKGWASTAFLLGIGVSVAANVAHTYHIPGAEGRPPLGAQLAAGFYPVALLLVVEILSRVPWPSTWGWALARYGGASVVAAVAAVVSYRHMSSLLAAYGEDWLTAMIGPLAVDGLMVVASFALLAIGRDRGPEAVSEPAAEALPEVVEAEAGGWSRWPLPEVGAAGQPAVATALGNGPETASGPDVTALPEVPDDRQIGDVESTSPIEAQPNLDPLTATARDRFAETLATGSLPAVRQLRRELRIGYPRAKTVRAELEAHALE